MPPSSHSTHAAYAAFVEHFGAAPTHRVRAPGRVNLIGDHIDYVGLPVLPMALERAVELWIRRRADATVRVVNLDPAFGGRSIDLEPDPAPAPAGDWGNYLRAAGADRVRARGPLLGFDAVLASTLPPAAGLSSSSALVVATALALETVNGQSTPPLELAADLARAERFVGTQGGGMDQAIALGARAGHAARIDFDPLRVTHIPVPRGWRFVVAHSRVRAEKSAEAGAAYNERSRTARAALTAVREVLDGPDATPLSLIERYGVPALLDAGARILDATPLRRFRHVITEGERVRRAQAAMDAGDLRGFGTLMDASHASLRDDYGVSVPALDRLVEIAREAGAAGARLTGAGFGGSVVALSPGEAAARRVTEALEERYYAGLADPGPAAHRLFTVDAGPGASAGPAYSPASPSDTGSASPA